MSVGQSVEWELAGETEVLGENMSQYNFFPPQIPHNLTRARTRVALVGSRRITALPMAQTLSDLLKDQPLTQTLKVDFKTLKSNTPLTWYCDVQDTDETGSSLDYFKQPMKSVLDFSENHN
jgi:hypothetical protein